MMNGLQICTKGQQLYGYLSHRKPIIDSKKNLYGCKSLGTYYYVFCGHVHDLEFYDKGSDFSLLKGQRCGSCNSFVVLFWFCIFLYFAVKVTTVELGNTIY